MYFSGGLLSSAFKLCFYFLLGYDDYYMMILYCIFFLPDCKHKKRGEGARVYYKFVCYNFNEIIGSYIILLYFIHSAATHKEWFSVGNLYGTRTRQDKKLTSTTATKKCRPTKLPAHSDHAKSLSFSLFFSFTVFFLLSLPLSVCLSVCLFVCR